jgi:superfamily II DNA/RNA helicase
MDFFNTCSLTQAIIFVNTKGDCEFVQNTLRKNDYESLIMFGEMSKEERDKAMRKFRGGEVNVIIATNMLTVFARHFNFPEVEIVINFDVPTLHLPNG